MKVGQINYMSPVKVITGLAVLWHANSIVERVYGSPSHTSPLLFLSSSTGP
jgi:hypothetical protein